MQVLARHLLVNAVLDDQKFPAFLAFVMLFVALHGYKEQQTYKPSCKMPAFLFLIIIIIAL